MTHRYHTAHVAPTVSAILWDTDYILLYCSFTILWVSLVSLSILGFLVTKVLASLVGYIA